MSEVQACFAACLLWIGAAVQTNFRKMGKAALQILNSSTAPFERKANPHNFRFQDFSHSLSVVPAIPIFHSMYLNFYAIIINLSTIFFILLENCQDEVQIVNCNKTIFLAASTISTYNQWYNMNENRQKKLSRNVAFSLLVCSIESERERSFSEMT